MAAVQIFTQTAQTLVIPRPKLLDISAFYGIFASQIITSDTDAVGGEIFNVMATLVGDDIMNPEYGCNLPLRVFEPITPAMAQTCLSDAYFAIQRWVPQVVMNLSQTIVYANGDNRMVGVGVAYSYSGGNWLQDVSLALNSSLSGNLS